ncbi:NgoFVII family restriction endonuclease [Bacillus sp. 7586-K]|nr:NgoFVII family restriction endonuclease [Bacillus sp. 7586-K]
MKKSNWKKGLSFTLLTTIFGLMLAIQFQTIKEPIVRDTRDMWELRDDLKEEQQLQVKLLSEIRKYDEIIETYKLEENENPEAALKETLNVLKEEAGLTEVEGPGVIITIDRLFSEDILGMELDNISPDLLKRLINELNSYDAEEISIQGRRLINSTVIRDINGQTKMDNYSLNTYPIEIKVISENAEKLYNRMNASTTDEDFAIDNLKLTISEPIDSITIPAYDDTIRVKNMKPVEKEEGGK